MSLAAAINVARKYATGGAVDTNPSPAQKEAGNYKMRHITFQGIPITIENPKGTIRSGVDANGKFWSNRMTADYGYIKRTEGKDGDQVDAFVGPNKQSDRVFIIDQLHHHMEKFDEHKCLVGFNTRKQALTAYHGSYGRKYGAHHTVGAVTELSIDAFKEWLKGGGGKEPIAPDVPKFQAGGSVSDEQRSLVFDPAFVGKTQPEKTPNIRVTEGHQEFEKGYVASGRSPWNTDYPYRPILNMRGQELHALKIQTGGAVKATKAKAHYRIGTRAEHCGICTMFQAPDSCTAVMGKIRWMDNCDYFEKKKAKYQEGGAVEDVPGVGPVPTAMPELPDPVKAAAQAYSETPSWLEQATQEAKQSGEAYQRGEGLSGMLADTRSAQELAGGFGGTTIGKVGGIAKAGQEAVHHWSQSIADTLVAKHGNDIEALQNSLNGIHQATSDRAATAILAKLPEDVQHELAVRDLNAAYDRVMRERNMVFEHPLGETPTAPAFREITHPDEARDWLRENATGHVVNWDERDPQYYVELANKMKKEQAGLTKPAETVPEPEAESAKTVDLDEFFGQVSPSQVQHLSTDELLKINDSLTKHPDPYSFQTENPELWDAFHQRLDEVRSRSERVQEAGNVVPFTTPQSGVPGPWGYMSQDFQQLFKQHIQPHANWFPSGRNDERSFFNKFYAGADTSQVSATTTPDPHNWGNNGLAFDGPIFIGGKTASPALQVEIFPASGYAHHSYFKLSPEFRSTDLGHTLMSNWIDLYKQMGLNRVDLYAALQSGPYVWNKYGFVPQAHYWDDIRNSLQNLILRNHFKITDQQTRADVMSILRSENPKASWLLADVNKSDDYGNNIGKAAFLGYELNNRLGNVEWPAHNWEGSLNLNDRQSMERFDAWIRKQIQKKSTTQQ